MNAEERSNQANNHRNRVVTSEDVRLLKNNITHTHPVLHPSQLQRNDVQKFQSWNSDIVPILMVITDTNQLFTLLKLQRFIVYLAKELKSSLPTLLNTTLQLASSNHTRQLYMRVQQHHRYY
jgi:hypothetical protein